MLNNTNDIIGLLRRNDIFRSESNYLYYTPRNATGDEARSLLGAATASGVDTSEVYQLGDADQPGSFYPFFGSLEAAKTLAHALKVQLWAAQMAGDGPECLDLLRDFREKFAEYYEAATPRGRKVRIFRQLTDGYIRYGDSHGTWARSETDLLQRLDEQYYAPPSRDNFSQYQAQYSHACGYYD